MGTLTLALATWLFAGGVGPTSRVAGQDTGDELRDEEARQLFEAGRLAFTAGRFESALHSFERAHELSGRALLLYNIGTCHDRLRRDRQALETFRRYLFEVPDAANRSEVEARITLLEDAVDDNAAPVPLTEPVSAESEGTTPLDLSVAPAAGTQDDGTGVFEEWWFWAIVGAVVAGGVIAAVLVATAEDSTEAPILGSTGVVSRAFR